MVFAAAFVAPQAFFDADRGLFCAVIGIRGRSFGFEQCPGVKVQQAFGAEAEAVFADGGIA
jgi:hypothetical protein